MALEGLSVLLVHEANDGENLVVPGIELYEVVAHVDDVVVLRDPGHVVRLSTVLGTVAAPSRHTGRFGRDLETDLGLLTCRFLWSGYGESNSDLKIESLVS